MAPRPIPLSRANVRSEHQTRLNDLPAPILYLLHHGLGACEVIGGRELDRWRAEDVMKFLARFERGDVKALMASIEAPVRWPWRRR
jgi:hypothetical protein